MKHHLALLLYCMGFCYTANSQTLAQYNDLAKKNDSLGQQALLKKWEKTGVNDPDFYIATFNYYAKKARREIISLQKAPGDGESFALTDSLNKTAGYLTGDVMYDAKDIDKAIAIIDKGIAKFPNRLDMRFGKAYILGEDRNFDGFTTEIIAAIEYSVKIKNKWLWSNAKPLEDAQNFMLGTTQKYVYQLYETEDDALLDNMQRITQTVLKYYPNHVESLSSLAVVYMLQNQPDKALEPLLKATKIDPKDGIVLGNIAQAYKMKGDKSNAIKYYELVQQYGDADAKNYAAGQIEKLKSK